MPIQLLRELLGLDDKSNQAENIKQDTNNIRDKDTSDIRDKDTSDISSNLLKTIVKAHKPVNIDLEFMSDLDTDSDMSYDSFFDQAKN